MKKLAAVSALFLAVCSPALAADAIGEWLVKDKTARIAVSPCGEALCGKISWTLTPGGVDEKNPDPARRNDPIIGIEILQSMKPTAPNRWEGNIYNAENGKIYKASITLDSPDILKVEGCVLGILCGGESWTRFKEEPGRPARAGQAGRPAASASPTPGNRPAATGTPARAPAATPPATPVAPSAAAPPAVGAPPAAAPSPAAPAPR